MEVDEEVLVLVDVLVLDVLVLVLVLVEVLVEVEEELLVVVKVCAFAVVGLIDESCSAILSFFYHYNLC